MSWTDLMPEPIGHRVTDMVKMCKDRKDLYPFGVKTDGTKLQPKYVEEQLNCCFMRMPFRITGCTYWGFERETDRQIFIARFGGQPL